jgi:outer membrane lipoprotein-sorting protein
MRHPRIPRLAQISFAISRRTLLGALAGLPFIAAAGAADPGLKLTQEDKADLTRVAAYLDGIRSLRARFQQIASTGGIAFGKIYLRRPGDLRVEYDPPIPVLLVADGFWVSYYDKQLDQLTQIPIEDTPIWFLVQNTIQFTDKITVTDIERSPGAIRLTMHQADKPDAGSASLTFADEPLELRQWKIKDSQGTEVEIALQDAEYGGALSNDLFARPHTRKQTGATSGGRT